jgi:exopolysaccharide biosynthesis polyprenyl glycosylphosphotransferase
MLKEYKKTLNRIYRLLDILILLLSFYAAYYLRFGPIDLKPFNLNVQYAVFFSTFLIAWFYLSSRFQVYESKRLTHFKHECWDVSKTNALCLVIATVPAFFIRHYPLSHLFLLYLWLLQTALFLSFRFILRETLKYIRQQGYNYRQVLIVGRNSRASKIAKKIKETPEFGLRIVGFIDATENENGASSSCDVELMGNLYDLESILRNEVVDEVFVTLPIKSYYSKIEEIIYLCEKVGMEVLIPMDLFQFKLAKSNISTFDDIQLINFYTSPKMSWQFVVKRLIDVVGASVLLALSFPLFVGVGILIKATSKGPILFKQQRVGYNGRIFSFLKFRTMVENAEALKKDLLALNEMDGPVFKIRNDPRTTKFGRFLRKTSIDELPQLINVLKGDMSLVGPRPPVPDEVNQYVLSDRRRLSMRPGITCLWQVSGRNTIKFEKWMELDRQYIDQWSLWLDIKILASTVPAVFKGSGAA